MGYFFRKRRRKQGRRLIVVSCIQPGNNVFVKVYQRKWNAPRWEGPSKRDEQLWPQYRLRGQPCGFICITVLKIPVQTWPHQLTLLRQRTVLSWRKVHKCLCYSQSKDWAWEWGLRAPSWGRPRGRTSRLLPRTKSRAWKYYQATLDNGKRVTQASSRKRDPAKGGNWARRWRWAKPR